MVLVGHFLLFTKTKGIVQVTSETYCSDTKSRQKIYLCLSFCDRHFETIFSNILKKELYYYNNVFLKHKYYGTYFVYTNIVKYIQYFFFGWKGFLGRFQQEAQ